MFRKTCSESEYEMCIIYLDLIESHLQKSGKSQEHTYDSATAAVIDFFLFERYKYCSTAVRSVSY